MFLSQILSLEQSRHNALERCEKYRSQDGIRRPPSAGEPSAYVER